ncbi:MAG: HEAT repeat domain-containing protein [Planctomycetes bacterium]|nr:HEAT repeat domain-containing protein [Planctomycetota bacterium]
MDLIEYLQESVMRHQSARDLGNTLLGSKCGATRHAAAAELARRGESLLDQDGQSAVAALVSTLADADEELAGRAADALADMGETVSAALFEVERHPIHDPHGLAFELLELGERWTFTPRVRKCPSGRTMWRALSEFDWHYRRMGISQPSNFSGLCFSINGREYAVEWVASLATGIPAQLLAATGDNMVLWLGGHPDYPPLHRLAED